MCGLFGIAGPGIQQADLNIFRDLGIVSQVRGIDGSGFYQVKSMPAYSNNDYSGLYKTQSTFSEMLFELDYKKTKKSPPLLDSIAVDVIIGHVRAATRGKISDDNSHPFNFDNIVGAHNGTLRDKKYEHKDKTDSEMMFQEISNRGMIKTLEDMDKNSAYAISLFDKKLRRLYFVRNDKRTLHFALNENRGVLYWASEPEILKFVLRRAKVEFHGFSILPGFLWEVTPSNIPTAKAFKENKKPFIKIVHDFNPVVEETKVVDAPFDGGVIIKQEEEVKSQETISDSSEKKVVRFPTNNFRAFYNRCVCGTSTLNLLKSDLCRKGKLNGFSYDETNNSYYCNNCTKEQKHAVH